MQLFQGPVHRLFLVEPVVLLDALQALVPQLAIAGFLPGRGGVRIYVDITISFNEALYKTGRDILTLMVQERDTEQEIFDRAIRLVSDKRSKILPHCPAARLPQEEIQQAAE